jgi:hypothetical protein
VGPPAPGATWAVRGCALAYMGQGHQPQGAHAPRVSKGEESHKWKAPLGALGGRETSLGRRPPRRLDLLGPAPPLALLYIVREGGLFSHTFGCLLLPLQHLLLLHSAWRSPDGVLQLHHHHAVVLLLEPSSSTSPSPLLDQEGGDVTLTVRVLNAEVPSVRC